MCHTPGEDSSAEHESAAVCLRKAGETVIREHGAGPKALILLQQRLGLWRATCATKLRDWLKTGRSGENFQETPAHSDSYSYSKFLLKKHIHLNMYGPTWALFCWIGCLYFLIHASPSSLSLYESHCCSCRFIVILYSILCIVILYNHTTWTSKTILKCSVHFYETFDHHQTSVVFLLIHNEEINNAEIHSWQSCHNKPLHNGTQTYEVFSWPFTRWKVIFQVLVCMPNNFRWFPKQTQKLNFQTNILLQCTQLHWGSFLF